MMTIDRVMTPVIMMMVVFSGIASAAEKLNARGQKEMAAIYATIQQNFHASNQKDVNGVMDTLTPDAPNREAFVEELKQFFEDVDCYLRVIDVQFIEADRSGKVVRAVVVQETMVGGEEGDDVDYTEFRSRSAMLPPWPVCKYEVEMHKVRGKWQIHEILTAPEEVSKDGESCEDGACPFTTADAR